MEWDNAATVKRLFESNKLASAAERTAVLAMISNTRELLTTLDPSIIGTPEILRARIQDYIDACNALLSPARGLFGLPTELLAKIFLWALPIHDGTLSNLKRAWCHPLLLSHVCRHWRDVAISAPVLWTCLVLADSPPGNEQTGSGFPPEGEGSAVKYPHPELVNLFLSRAGEHPLSMWVAPELGELYGKMYGNEHFLETNVARCKSLVIFMSPKSIDGGATSTFHALELPKLEALEITQNRTPNSPWPKDASLAVPVTQLPRLRYFKSNRADLDQFYGLDVPWSQLTALSISLHSLKCLQRFPSIIAECHNLADLALNVGYSILPASSPGGGVTLFEAAKLPLLETLDIYMGLHWNLIWQKDTYLRAPVTELPRLRHFRSNRGDLDQFFGLDVPWSRLTSLSVSLPTPECLQRFLSIIQDCRELVELTLEVLPASTWSDEHSVIHLAKLKELDIHYRVDRREKLMPLFMQGFVDALMVPQLENLVVRPPDEPLHLWTNMLIRSQCALLRLDIQLDVDDFDTGMDDLLSLFQSIQSLRGLAINFRELHFTPRALDFCHYLVNGTPSVTDPSLSLPDLGTLSLSFTCYEASDFGLFLDKLQYQEDPRSEKTIKIHNQIQSVIIEREPSMGQGFVRIGYR